MPYPVQEWLNLAIRWTHMFAGILWIGATWYFTWLDRRFHTTDPDEVWMVHSGGFYQVRKVGTPSPSHTLHWFRWEAAYTWLTGMALLALVYYGGGLMSDGEPGKLFLPPSWHVGPSSQATLAGVATLIVAWLLYDLLLARHHLVALVGGLVCIMALQWELNHLLSPRAAMMHVGAALGTCMAFNVWMRIIPAQKQMVRVAREGGVPDQKLADRAKTRSKHNTYLIMPVLLIMISNHFPIALIGSPRNWLILGILTVGGWIAAHIVRNH